MLMKFGEYKGVYLEDLPSGYLKWLSENCYEKEVREAAIKEYNYRDDNHKHVEDWSNV